MNNNLRKTLAAVLLLFLLSIKVAVAQTTSPQALSFNIGLDAGIPVGSEHETSNFALGISPQLQYATSNNFRIILTTGIYNYFSKTETIVVNLGVYFLEPGSTVAGSYTFNTSNRDIVPIKAGFKYLFAGNWYYGLEAGVEIVASNGGGAGLDAATGFGYIKNNWDFGVRFEEFINPSNGGTIFLRAAYSFL